MSTTGNPCDPFRCEEIAAAQLLGAVWNWCLYGALVVQFYVYRQYSYIFPRDNKFLNVLVHGIFFLETLQTVFSGADLYYWFAAGFGNVDQLTVPFGSSIDVSIMGSVVSLGVQFFFVYRIFMLSEKRSWLLCAVICLLSIISALGAFAAGISSFIKGVFMRGKDLEAFEMTWLVGNTLSDLLIASAMIYHLRRIWGRDSKLSRHILVRIVRLTVETNLVTTTVSILALLMVALYPEKNWYLCPTYILGKLYSNTLLVSLNNRIAIGDSDDARGGFVDCQEVAGSRGGSISEATKVTTLVPERPPKYLKKHLVLEAEV